jgi:DNA-binding transcriptional regulator/RsmH inhibitor MraZ
MKLKDKNQGPNCMTIDTQRRLCLSERVRNEFGIQKSDYVFLTLDHNNVLLVFLNVKDMKSYAHTLVEKTSVSPIDAEFLLFDRKVQVRLDQRGRISIPENLLKETKLEETAKVTALGNRLEIMSPEANEKRRKNIANCMRVQCSLDPLTK